MKRGRPLFRILAFVLATVSVHAGTIRNFQELSGDEIFPSPDSRYFVSLDVNENIEKIKDALSGTSTNCGYLPPILGVFWLKDSTAFCSVEHIAEGSILYIHAVDRNGKWNNAIIEPDLDGISNYEVIRLETGKHSAIVTYKLHQESPEAFYILKILAEADGSTTILKKQPVSLKAYKDL